MTHSPLNDLLNKWQGRLRLRDWDIDVRMCYSVGEFLSPGSSNRIAECIADHKSKNAIINILKVIPDTVGLPYPTTEESLVHELVHLLIEPLLRDGSDDCDGLEYVTTQLTKIIWNAYEHNGQQVGDTIVPNEGGTSIG